MSGNCATGIAPSASRPASEMTIEMTSASRGRWMKTDEITASPLALGWRCRSELRRDGHSGADTLLALNAHALAFRDDLLDHEEALAQGAEANPTLLDLVVLRNHEDIGPGLVDGDGRLRDDDHLAAGLL